MEANTFSDTCEKTGNTPAQGLISGKKSGIFVSAGIVFIPILKRFRRVIFCPADKRSIKKQKEV